MGYLKGFSHGIMVGAVVGVLLAPRRGRDTREALEITYHRTRRRAERAAEGLSSGWQSAQPALRMVARAADSAGRMVQPVVRTAGDRISERSARVGSLPGRNGGAA
jgi:gas vesicle protein